MLQLTLLAAFALPIVLFLLPADFFDHGKSMCVSVLLFDAECYGCGSTRAIMHLLHFDFDQAWNYNKLSYLVLPALIFGWGNVIYDTRKKLKNKYPK